MASKETEMLYRKKLMLWKRLIKYEDFMRGSIVTLKRPCTYKGCRKCADGTKHPTTYYSISRKNKTELTYLPTHIQPKIKRLIKNYQEVNGLIDEISEITIKIIKSEIKARSKR